MFDGLPIFLGDATYIDLNVAKSIVSGHGISTGPNIHGIFTPFGKRPPGFSLLVAFFVSVGVPILKASTIIASISYALIPVFVFLIFINLFNYTKSVLMAIAVLLLPSLIYYSKIAAPEIIGVLVLCISYYLYLSWIEFQEKGKSAYFLSFLLGLILGLTIWFRYTNVIYVVLFSGLILLYPLFSKGRWENSLLTLLLGGIVSASLLYRNFLYTGHLSGHPINNVKTNDMDVAIVKSLNYLTAHIFDFDVNDNLIAILFVSLLIIMSIFIILNSYKNKIFLLKVLPISLMPLAYLLFFSYAQSITRVDDVSTRYLLPLYLTGLIQVFFILYSIKFKRKLNFFYMSIIMLSISMSGFYVILKYSPHRIYNDRDYSPETIDYILKNIEKGSTLIGSRYLGQLLIHSLDYNMIGLKFYSEYNRAYGRQLTNRKSDLIKKILDKNVKYIILFTGADKNENFLNRDDYGEFITSMIEKGTDIVESTIELDDGIVFKLKDKNELMKIHNIFKNKTVLLDGDLLGNGLTIKSSVGSTLISEKGISLSQLAQAEPSNPFVHFSFDPINSFYSANVNFSLPVEKLKMIAITLRNDSNYAHYFFNPNEFKSGKLGLRFNNIDNSSGDVLSNVNSMTIRLYPLDENSRVSQFRLNSIELFTEG